ncbi:uncharacterized protein BO96DRAFT_348540 [Aspergillus niger CBS 101883]|uniref:uncharacterized protein n=1 Tax=Aspergillus lacticoffeatus (strain CBS 101883) TaxID=1450533 RepID=UPI000D7EDB25|nr:uncharacterized protein BO96DRAFT_348540 [Aspergillus niger CBS 101883]PYH52103.1 hypothetical protein BO96DRAFT_348540 [Aspergillus niger CBS 101883]
MVHNRECVRVLEAATKLRGYRSLQLHGIGGHTDRGLSIRLLSVERTEPRNPSREVSTGRDQHSLSRDMARRVFLSLAVSPSFRAWVQFLGPWRQTPFGSHGVTAKNFSRRVVANQLPICYNNNTSGVNYRCWSHAKDLRKNRTEPSKKGECKDIFSQLDPHIVYPSPQVASPSITSHGWSRVLLGTNRMCGTMVTEWQQRSQNYNPLVSQPKFSTSYQYGTGVTVQPQRCLSLTRLAGRIRAVD